VSWVQRLVLVTWIPFRLWLRFRLPPDTPMSQMSNSECSSLEEQMRGRLPSCRGSATQQRVRRSTGLVRQVLAVGYVLIALIPNGGFNLMVYPGQTRPHYRGWIRIFFRESLIMRILFDSMATTILRTNSSSRTMRDMFSTTHADLRREVRTS